MFYLAYLQSIMQIRHSIKKRECHKNGQSSSVKIGINCDMKTIGALSFAAFYLMLTTGMFVCMLHCSGNFLLTGNKEGMAGCCHKEGTGHHQSKKKDNCCAKHSEYVVKENIEAPVKTDLNLSYSLLAPVLYLFPGFVLPENTVQNQTWVTNTGPPLNLKIPLYLSNRVLLI